MGYVWLCPKPAAPSGGVMFINRWSSLLSKLGIESSILKAEPFEIWWDDGAPVNRETRYAKVEKDDTVIIPEVMWIDYSKEFPTQHKICLMQNWLWMDARFDWSGIEVVTCSRYLSNYARRVFNMKVLGIVRPYLDDDIFAMASAENPRHANSILVMERRNTLGPTLVEKFTGLGFGTEYVTGSISRKALIAAMSRCEYYVHTVTPEGFPLICLESMRSGALVVGTSGGGGNEFMFDGLNCIVTQDPVHGFITDAEFVEQIVDGVVSLSKGKQEVREAMVEKAYDWSLRYTKAIIMAELSKAFSC